jgi:hypothetical protein
MPTINAMHSGRNSQMHLDHFTQFENGLNSVTMQPLTGLGTGMVMAKNLQVVTRQH